MNVTRATAPLASFTWRALLRCAALATLAMLPLVGCNTSSSSGEKLAILGTFNDNFGGTETFTTTTITDGFGDIWHILSFDTLTQSLVAQNDPGNAFYPGLFSQFDWTTYQGKLYFCQIDFNAESPADAAATSPADATNPPATGCGGFPWTQLTPKAGS